MSDERSKKIIFALECTLLSCRTYLRKIWCISIIFLMLSLALSFYSSIFVVVALLCLILNICLRLTNEFCKKLFDPEDSDVTFDKESKRLKQKYDELIVNFGKGRMVNSNMPNIGERMVRYPISFLARSLLFPLLRLSDRMQVSNLRRVNPRCELRLKHLLRSNGDRELSEDSKRRFSYGLSKVFDIVGYSTEAFKSTYVSSLITGFQGVKFDGSAAAGYPWRPGTKKKDVVDEAYSKADYELNNGCPCLSKDFDADFHPEYEGAYYRGPHIWYTGGRGKMKEGLSLDSARNIQFSGFSIFLLTSTFLRPVMDAYNACPDTFSKIGLSWFYGGCNVFFRGVLTFLHGIKSFFSFFLSLDVAGWDSDYNKYFFECFRDELFLKIHDSVKDQMDEELWFKWRIVIIKVFDDVIERHVWLGTFLFHIVGAMPSGFSGTADLNTLAHECMMRGEDFAWISFVFVALYGDDNYIAGDDGIKEKVQTDLRRMYDRYYFKIKHINIDSDMSKVDFLSVYPKKVEGKYVVTKDVVETYAKFVCPDDGYVDDSPNMICARILGFLAILWKDPILGPVFYKMLCDLCEREKKKVITLNADLKKVHWSLKYLDWKDIHIDEVPNFLNNLHEDVIPEGKLDYEELNKIKYTKVLDFSLRDISNSIGKAYDDVCSGLSDARARMSDKQDVLIKRTISPFKKIFEFAGHAGGKCGEILVTFKDYLLRLSMKDKTSPILVVGSHPGSDLCCIKRVFPERSFHIISAIANWDASPFLCKASKFLSGFDLCVQSDFSPNLLLTKYFMAFVDVAYGREHGEVDYSRYSLRSALRHFDLVHGIVSHLLVRCQVIVCKLNGLHDDMISRMYHWYRYSELFDLRKVRCSYPWNVEYHVTIGRFGVQRSSCISLTHFRQSVYAFWNAQSDTRLCWQMLRQQAMRGKDVEINPFQEQDHEDLRKSVVPDYQLGGVASLSLDSIDLAGCNVTVNRVEDVAKAVNWPIEAFEHVNVYRQVALRENFLTLNLKEEKHIRSVFDKCGLVPTFFPEEMLHVLEKRRGVKFMVVKDYDGFVKEWQIVDVVYTKEGFHPYKVVNLDTMTRPTVSQRRSKLIFKKVGRIGNMISLYCGSAIDSLFTVCDKLTLVDIDISAIRCARYNLRHHMANKKKLTFVNDDVCKVNFSNYDCFYADPPFGEFVFGKVFSFGSVGFSTFPVFCTVNLADFFPHYKITVLEPGFCFLEALESK